ncbi:MAG: type IV toxin-antitoxin system AbiEi family antitoxin [Gammaproteobacteria bacterium]|jgi:predicted transcriptional regulator of viral defense system
MRLSEYIDFLIAHGKCCFSLDEAEEYLGKKRSLVIKAINHQKKLGRIASPAKGFYVIVSPEYRIYGCLPAEYFIPYLMKYWEQDYYAGLLTAALYHGASHQKPQIFQVITNKKRPVVYCGKIKVVFYLKKWFNNIAFQNFSTSKGILKISTPEQTAIDLFLYSKQSGGINHIATVLAELSEAINSEKLLSLIQKHPYGAWQQRMGYLFDELGEKKLATAVEQNIQAQKRIIYIPLAAMLQKTNKKYKRDKKWKIIINSTIETDL